MSEKKPLFLLLCELGEKDNIPPLNEHVACWERKIDDQWWIAVNGHRDAIKNSRGGTVPPFNCIVEFNGWPAGMFDPYGGIIAVGDAANEEAFAAALERAIAA